MTGNIVAGKNNDGYKYGRIAEKPLNLTRHYFTCNIILTKKIVNPPNFTCHIAKFYPYFLSRLRICLQFQSKITFKIKRLFPGNYKLIIDDQYILHIKSHNLNFLHQHHRYQH